MSADPIAPRLLQHLTEIGIPRHPIWDPLGHQRVRAYLHQMLAQWGKTSEHRFAGQQVEGCNLLLKLPGRQADLPPWLVGAHYDGVPGIAAADDNATGVAALLFLAERWAQDPPRRPVWVVAFDLEEWGMLGGAALARQLRQEGQELYGMLSLEMLGFTSDRQRYPISSMEWVYGKRGDFIALVGNPRSLAKLVQISRAIAQYVPCKILPVPDRGRSLPDTRLSDHSPFWDEGYDAVMVTDTAFLRNPHYHQASDTIATLDLPFFWGVTQGLGDAIAHL